MKHRTVGGYESGSKKVGDLNPPPRPEPVHDGTLDEWEKLVSASDTMWKPALLTCIQEVRRLRERDADAQGISDALDVEMSLRKQAEARVKQLEAEVEAWQRGFSGNAEELYALRERDKRYYEALEKIRDTSTPPDPIDEYDPATIAQAALSQQEEL